jgi:L-asparaginase/Glu-tRNA(Gln) amidotransferase subunit D
LYKSDQSFLPARLQYDPFRDSSDLGPADWATIAADVRANYLHFDGFVVLTGTDTMAYCATALSFMLENLGNDYWRSRVMVME